MTTIKPGQIYVRAVNASTELIMVVQQVDSFENTASIRTVLQFKQAPDLLAAPPTLAWEVNKLQIDGTLLTDPAEVTHYRELIVKRLTAYHFDVDYYRTMWADLDQSDAKEKVSTLQIGTVYRYALGDAWYLMVDTDSDGQPLFLEAGFMDGELAGGVHYGSQYLTDATLKNLVPATNKEAYLYLTSVRQQFEGHSAAINHWTIIVKTAIDQVNAAARG